MFVKICGITNEQDALLCVALGADAVGFVFAPSQRRVAVDRARDIARRIPSDVLTVGVFRDEIQGRVVELTQRAGLGAAQLHGNETAEACSWVAQRVTTVIKAFPAGHPDLNRSDDYGADIVLLDSPKPGSGRVFDWSLAEGMPLAGYRILLAGGLDPDNVLDAINKVRPWGVDVSTGVESEPGKKDPTRLRAFIEAAKSAIPASQGAITRDEPGPYDWAEDS